MPDGTGSVYGKQISFAISMFSSTPASCAIAGRCSMEFVEQPSAISTVRAFKNASFVMMSRGRDILLANQLHNLHTGMLCQLDTLQNILPELCRCPLSPMPSASVRQFMVFAVYIPEQEPQVGHTFSSYSCTLFHRSWCLLHTEPTASNIEDKASLSAVHMACQHWAAANENRRDIQSCRCHQKTGHIFITVRDT